jgi:hypothetical protein
MSYVLSEQQKWKLPPKPVVLGPFAYLRDGVSGSDPARPTAPPIPKADFFMWEHFTTKPWFHPSSPASYPPLKKIGEIYTPWPSWHIAASTTRFPSPETDSRLANLCEALDEGIAMFEADPERVVRLLGTAEFGCLYAEEDAREWLKDVKFVSTGTRGVKKDVILDVVKVLKVAGVVPDDINDAEALERVIGIPNRGVRSAPGN